MDRFEVVQKIVKAIIEVIVPESRMSLVHQNFK